MSSLHLQSRETLSHAEVVEVVAVEEVETVAEGSAEVVGPQVEEEALVGEVVEVDLEKQDQGMMTALTLTSMPKSSLPLGRRTHEKLLQTGDFIMLTNESNAP